MHWAAIGEEETNAKGSLKPEKGRNAGMELPKTCQSRSAEKTCNAIGMKRHVMANEEVKKWRIKRHATTEKLKIRNRARRKQVDMTLGVRPGGVR
eukprot:6683723-Karenia_brevis.AAC.1